MRYIARNYLLYVSTDTGERKKVAPGEEFDDMAEKDARVEIADGNMEEVKDDTESDSGPR